MKKLIFTIISICLFAHTAFTQDKINRPLPPIEVKTTDGSVINFKNIDNNNMPIVINFWATWCKPCKKELNNIAEVYEDWQDETGVKIIAISIDDTRSSSKVMPYVNSVDWEYEIYLDPNGDFKRSMGVSTIPHTFLLNGNKEIVWQHRGYVEGDEEELYNEILKLVK